jgi:hypothetical protein
MLSYYQRHCSQLQQVSQALCEAVGLCAGDAQLNQGH